MFHLPATSPPARQQASLAVDTVNPAHVATRLAGANVTVEGPSLVDSSGQPYPVRSGAVTRIGRALDNEIVVSHSSVSRHHASIENSNVHVAAVLAKAEAGGAHAAELAALRRRLRQLGEPQAGRLPGEVLE